MAEPLWVVLDTDVFSHLCGSKRRRHPDIDLWRSMLVGRTVVIATQTRAEVLAGLAQNPLGADRTTQLLVQLEGTPTVPVTEQVIQAYASLTSDCRRIGHGLGGRTHTGDRWVASTAIAIGAPLLALDGIYMHAPGLTRLEDSETYSDD